MAAAEDLPQDLVFVDLETTGGNATYDRITEVGLVRVSNGEVVEEWSSLVNPERPIPSYIEAFTGISNEMVAGAPRFGEIAVQLREKLAGAVFVAHNARFDYSFLRSEFRNADRDFSAKVLCTVKLSRRLFPEFARHNLDAVMERHGLSCSARHRALGDAQVLVDFWFKMRREQPPAQLAAAVQTVLGAHTLPDHLPPGLAGELPEGPGVYRFFDADGALLYVGRSHSLRERVCRHFWGADSVSEERLLAASVRHVDWRETAGELGAVLLEGRWIKTQAPTFNRRTKSQAQSHTLRAVAVAVAAGPGQALKIEPVAVDGVNLDDLPQCFGVFHCKKDASKAFGEIVAAHQLCRKVLGLEDGAGSCFAYQVGKCKGACLGKEALILHNMRVQLALASLKLKTWPFPGRIALRERDPRGGHPRGGHPRGGHPRGGQPRDGTSRFERGADVHVLDQWAYLGTARNEEELAALRSQDSSAAFEVDVYRILVRYFAKNPRPDWLDLRRDGALAPLPGAMRG